MFGLFKSKTEKWPELVRAASKTAAEQFLFFKDIFDRTTKNVKIDVPDEAFWSDAYILGIVAGLVEINILQEKLPLDPQLLCLGWFYTVKECRGHEQAQNVVDNIMLLYEARNERCKLAATRTFKFIEYACGMKEHELEPDFIDVRNKISLYPDVYEALMGMQWMKAKDRAKVVSVFLSEKLVLEAIKIFRPESTGALEEYASTPKSTPETPKEPTPQVSQAEKDHREFYAGAVNGDAQSQVNLGKAFLEGYGVTKDAIHAFNWFRKAAEQGHSQGQYLVGFLYSTGTGVRLNYEEAEKWLGLAAAQGNALAQASLQKLYAEGYSPKQKSPEASDNKAPSRIIECGRCSKKLRVPVEIAGIAKCPSCQHENPVAGYVVT